jgi:hypothetical protein
MFVFHASFYHAESVCFKSVIQSGRSLFLPEIKNTLLKLPVGVSPGVEKPVDTHQILINAITFYVCLQEI